MRNQFATHIAGWSNCGLRIADCGICVSFNPKSEIRNPKSRFAASPRRRVPASQPAGFTLVELLVAIALMVLIMSMFAQVFRTASNLITRQKGMAENGQRARTLTTIIRGDIGRRTFRNVTPFAPGETDDTDRRGYFYYSENEGENDADDVLQFTIETGETEQPLFAHSLLLGANTDINQPEADDGGIIFDGGGGRTIVENQLGASRAAEVSYFLRNGNLYRRVMLIREPYDTSSPPPAGFDANQPYSNNQDNFWGDFDYSAYYGGAGLKMHVRDNLNTLLGAGAEALAFPALRFGHDRTTGQPREYACPDLTNPSVKFFMGRFTQGETSDPDFRYPGDLADLDAGGAFDDSPFDPNMPLGMTADAIVTYPNDNTRTIGNGNDLTFDGPRLGEDILLSNVHSFDVKIWDEGDDPTQFTPQFVDVGHNIPHGYFNKANDQHAAAGIAYGPTPPLSPPDKVTQQLTNRVFDTWHPSLDIDGGGNDPPPYRPVDTVSGNPVRLRAIQITIRFYDVSSNQMKQLTLQMSLVD